MESIGFKEWSLVCDALGRGEQSLVLRKGGIAEGRVGFSFRHREFFLFPTFFHEQIGKVRTAPNTCAGKIDEGECSTWRDPLMQTFAPREKGAGATVDENARGGGVIAISLYAKVKRAVRIEVLEIAEALAPLHVLMPEVVRERFAYKAGGLDVAFVRVFRLEREWVFQNEKRFGGCRSWVELPQPPPVERRAVLDQSVHARRLATFNRILGT